MKRNTFTQYILLYPGQSFLFCLLLRYLFVLLVPITNDEAYYWTWGKSLQLSYVDHPPGVALLAYFEGFLPLWDISSRLALRWLIPILHGISSYLLFSLAKYFPSEQQAKYKIRTFILTQFIPGFSFLGAFLLPDIGLLFALSCALSLVSKIYFDKIFSFARALSLGFFLGLSLLFKYHGFPLSGGLLLGLFFFCRKEQKIIPFLILTFLMMCLTFSPVLFWNYQHHWISFLFQTKHGFESPHFNLLFFARFILGCCLFVTPLVFYNFYVRLWFC